MELTGQARRVDIYAGVNAGAANAYNEREAEVNAEVGRLIERRAATDRRQGQRREQDLRRLGFWVLSRMIGFAALGFFLGYLYGKGVL